MVFLQEMVLIGSAADVAAASLKAGLKGSDKHGAPPSLRLFPEQTVDGVPFLVQVDYPTYDVVNYVKSLSKLSALTTACPCNRV